MMNQVKCANGRQFMGRIPCGGTFNVNASDLIKPLYQAFQVYLLPIILVISILFLFNPAGAADTKIIPKIAVGGAYDDNIFLSRDDKVSSSLITVSPGLEIDYQTLLSKLVVKADLDILSYLDESDLNRTNQYYRLSGDHRIKERWNASVDFNYFRDTTLNTYLQETGRVIDRIGRDFYEAGGSVGYDVTKISSISVDYIYRGASYEGDLYSDYDSHRGKLYYSHRLKNEQDTLSVGPSYYYRSNDFNDVDSFSLDFGWDRDWSSVTSSIASIGARYTNVKEKDGSEDDNWGAKASVDVTFAGIASSTTFRYFHDLRTTVDGDDVNVDNFYLTYRRLITERLGVGINGRLVFSYKLLDQDSDINDERYYWVEPRLFYQLTEHLDLSLRYRYQNNVEYADEGDQTRERNIVWLELSYGFPMLL
jgi:hypothetical protein